MSDKQVVLELLRRLRYREIPQNDVPLKGGYAVSDTDLWIGTSDSPSDSPSDHIADCIHFNFDALDGIISLSK